MASSGSASTIVTSYDTLKFSWWVISQSTTNNQTVIGWSLQLIAGTAGRIDSSASKAWSVTVNGTRYSGSNNIDIANNAVRTLASGRETITHNADGSKNFSYTYQQEFSITFAGASVGTKSGGGTGILDVIPRATTPGFSATTVDMDTTMIIYTQGASESFTHDLAYSFAGGAYVSIATGAKDVTYWKIPLDFTSSIPNATSGTVTIRCITKSGGATIGTKTALLTVKVPTSVVPTISSVSLSEAAAGLPANVGAYVQSKSAVKATITAAGSRGSTIKSYSTTFLGKAYTGASWTSDTLTMSGTLSLVTTVTDSRGRTAQKITSITVLEYNAPTIATFTAARYNASGVADPDGTYARMRTVYAVTPLNNKNTATVKVEYKRSTATTWTALTTLSDLSMDGTLMPQGTTFSTDYEYDLRITLTDAFGASATYTASLPSGAVILDIRADGKGIAFFKTSTKEGVDIGGALPDSAIPLTTGQNLNALTSPGFYVIPSTTVSGTILNKPYTDTATASIEVKRTGDGKVVQILHKASKTDGTIYERGYDSSGWGAWGVVYSGAGKVLWSGGYVMTAGQTVTLSETISQQQSGIVLVFSRYISNAAVDYFYSCHFVPKQLVPSALSAGQTSAATTFMMATNKFEAIACKYLYIKDAIIGGNDANSASGASNGVTYNNGLFALRYVIGV